MGRFMICSLRYDSYGTFYSPAAAIITVDELRKIGYNDLMTANKENLKQQEVTRENTRFVL
jgi:hypothetical protein